MMADPSSGGEIAFGPFRLNVRARTLSRDGASIVLGVRTLDVLCALTASGGKLVTKDDLMARVWPGQVVEDNTIQVHVSALRKALGEADGGPRYILTVPGQGYRFIGEQVEQLSPQAVPSQGAPALPDGPSIAVLPFHNMSGDAEQDYFADGIVEDITTALTRFPALFVIARNSAFTYKGRAVDIRQVGRELGVRYVLEGSVRRFDDRLRITGQLIDAVTGSHLWADRFDGKLADIFDLQDEIAARVVGAIAPTLERAEIERATRKQTASLQAYDYYLRGLAIFHRERVQANDEALRLFYKAIELDPEFASAHGMAAWCYCQRLRGGWMTDLSRERIETKRLALRAAEFGRQDAVALCTAGVALALVVQELDAGIALIDQARQLNPNLAIAWQCSAWARGWRGEPEVAIEHATRCMRLSPLDSRIHMMEGAMAFAHFIAGRYDLAVLWAEASLRKQGAYQATLRTLAASHALAGRTEQARVPMARMRELNPAMRVSNVADIAPWHRPDDMSRYAEGLRIAGLPD
jgi:TolB-like protein